MQNDLLTKLLADADVNASSFERLYEHSERLIYSFALSFSRDSELCKEIKQDVFVKILKGANRSFKGGNALGWLYTITRNTALNILTKRGRESVGDIDESARAVNDDIIGDIAFNEIISLLDSELREIVILHLGEDLTLKTVAEILQLPLTTVKWRYRVAIKKLKKAMSKQL